jgi:hypothetical protein
MRGKKWLSAMQHKKVKGFEYNVFKETVLQGILDSSMMLWL